MYSQYGLGTVKNEGGSHATLCKTKVRDTVEGSNPEVRVYPEGTHHPVHGGGELMWGPERFGTPTTPLGPEDTTHCNFKVHEHGAVPLATS